MADRNYKLTFELSDGTRQSVRFTAPQGPQGMQGIKGDKGDPGKAGTAGSDGYTPVKGVDYWTEAELEQFYSHIDTMILERYAKGENIPSGSDLNNYKTFGKYTAISNATAKTLLNCPTTFNFAMYVFARTSNTVVSQLIIDIYGKLYLRSGHSSGWNDWSEYSTIEDMQQEVQSVLQEAKDSGEFTPIKGVDYWTAADKEAMVQEVIAALGTPVFGRVDAQNNIVLSGALADGAYVLKYEHSDGSLTEIGTVAVSGGGVSNAIALNLRLGKIDTSTGAISTAENYAYSDLVEIAAGEEYTLQWNDCTASVKICYYDASGVFIAGQTVGEINTGCETDVLSSGSAVIPVADGASYFRLRVYLNYYNDGYEESFARAQQGMSLIVSE